MKRTAVFIALLLLLLACAGAALAAKPVVEGDWKYEVSFTETSPGVSAQTARITRYNPVNDPPETLVVPEELGGYPVTEIENYAFTTYRTLENNETEDIPGPKTIILPAGLTKIGPGGFGYEELQEFRIENGVRYEARDGVLFDRETSTLLCYPKGRKGSSYTVPEGTLTIAEDAFDWPLWLTELHLADSVRRIEDNAISVSGLHLFIPEGIETIESGAVIHASSFTSLSSRYQVIGGLLVDTNEKRLISVPDSEKDNRTVTVPEGVKIIGERAFWSISCAAVSFPSTLRVIEDQNYFRHIDSGILELPEGLETIGDFFDPGDVKILSFPGSLRSIGKYSATYCDSLETVMFREGLESIGRNSFSHNENLVSVVLPASLKDIGTAFYDSENKAFEDCPKLTILLLPGTAAERFCKKTDIPYRYVFAGLWQADPAEAGEALSLQGAENILIRLEESTLELTYSLEGASRTESFPVEWKNDRLCMEGGYMEYELTDPEHMILKMNGTQLHLTKAEDPV